MATKKTKTRRTDRRTSASIYDTVTKTLIELLEGGTIPWRTRWSSVRPKQQKEKKPVLVPGQRLLLPLSISSGKPYKGINVLILWGAALKQRYSSPYWGSLNAWNQNGCRVKKGERAIHVVRWIEKTEVDPETGKEEEKSFPIIHSVFNVAQVQGPAEMIAKYGGNQPPLVMVPLSEPQLEPVLEPIRWEPAERLVAILNPRLRWGGNRACYSPRTDSIRMPDRDRFDTQAGLYTVLMHELEHWTGHPKRLDRDMSGADDTPEYWFEELVAELSGCFVLAALALPDRMEELPNSATYLKHHLDLLRDDRRKIVKAASLAQKAAAYILSGGVVSQEKKQRRVSPAQ